MEINFEYWLEGLRYAVMAEVSKRGGKYKMDSITIYFIRRNGSIVRRKTWDVTNSLAESKAAIIREEVFRRARINEL